VNQPFSLIVTGATVEQDVRAGVGLPAGTVAAPAAILIPYCT
jgi:hypothetical protein